MGEWKKGQERRGGEGSRGGEETCWSWSNFQRVVRTTLQGWDNMLFRKWNPPPLVPEVEQKDHKPHGGLELDPTRH